MNQEVYIRYLSFANKQEFKDEILKKCPEKIDIGAVYTGKPKMKNALKHFKPVQRELVFDIDMTDYDDIRTCCQGAAICNKCWKFMTVAMRLLDLALRECFGFKHILYVYSGRRGIHCWICDERARALTEESRKAIVSFLEIVKGGEQKSKKVSLSQVLHPFVESARLILDEYFDTVVLHEQDILSHTEKEEKFLDILPAPLRDDVKNIWSKARYPDSRMKWDLLVGLCKKDPKYQKIPVEIMFQYLYPRLDAQVSMHLNHLLKAPFCVHPKTGRICVPIRIEECNKFNPLNVPTIASLINDINDFDDNMAVEMATEAVESQTQSSQKSKAEVALDWQKTGMKEYIAIFDEFNDALSLERRKEAALKRMEEDQKLMF